MTRRARVLQAIQHHQTDFVPYQVDPTIPARERLIEYAGDPDYLEKIGNHIVGVSYGDFVQVEPGSDRWRDYYGVVWNRSVDKDIGVVEKLTLPEPDLGAFRPPEINEPRLRRDCEHLLETAGDKCTIYNLGFSMFERAWILRGMENLLTDMVTEPDFVHELLDAICEHNLKILDIALDYPFDGFMFGDDWGQQHGTITGPGYWRTFVKPRVARMYEKVKSKGKFVAQHSCGDNRELFPELIEIGLDVYNTFQPEIYDVRAVKREYGNDLAFWGGISTQKLLPFAAPEEIKRVTREMIKIMGAGGGYICGPTHGIPGDVPPENIVALVEALQEQ